MNKEPINEVVRDYFRTQGRKGALARVKALTPEKLSKIAKKAQAARTHWPKKYKTKEK